MSGSGVVLAAALFSMNAWRNSANVDISVPLLGVILDCSSRSAEVNSAAATSRAHRQRCLTRYRQRCLTGHRQNCLGNRHDRFSLVASWTAAVRVETPSLSKIDRR